jgi:hypothetical protein
MSLYSDRNAVAWDEFDWRLNKIYYTKKHGVNEIWDGHDSNSYICKKGSLLVGYEIGGFTQCFCGI